jgi:hypothetical protein
VSSHSATFGGTVSATGDGVHRTSLMRPSTCTHSCDNEQRLIAGGVFDGELESPLPSMFETMTKYLAGSRAMPSPIKPLVVPVAPRVPSREHDRIALVGVQLAVRLVRELGVAQRRPVLQRHIARSKIS